MARSWPKLFWARRKRRSHFPVHSQGLYGKREEWQGEGEGVIKKKKKTEVRERGFHRNRK